MSLRFIIGSRSNGVRDVGSPPTAGCRTAGLEGHRPSRTPSVGCAATVTEDTGYVGYRSCDNTIMSIK